MIITDTLNGHTVEDVRRNQDGSITIYCDSGRTLELYVENSEIRTKPAKIQLPDTAVVVQFSERMNLLTAFQGYMVNYVYYGEDGSVTFVCEPLRHERKKFKKAAGLREIRLSFTNGIIDELPPVSAKISLEGLGVLGQSNL